MNLCKFSSFLVCVFVAVAFHESEAVKYLPVIDEKFGDCGSSGFLDISGLELFALNDTHTYLNGSIKFIKEIVDPWEVTVSSTRFDRNQWHKGEVNRYVPDFCLELKTEAEPWYPITSKLKHSSCPIEAGSVEVFDMVPMVGFMIEIPSSFQGKWKLKLEMMFTDISNTEVQQECIEVNFEIMEA